MPRFLGNLLPFLPSANMRRIFFSCSDKGVVEVEDPNIPSSVVDTLEPLAPTLFGQAFRGGNPWNLDQLFEPVAQGTVGMMDMGFVLPAITVNVGTKVVWKNSSQVIHNVVDDASKALSRVDVKVRSGARPFYSCLLQPRQSFSRVFTEPGIYHYVCTLHEASGMKGAVIVKPSLMLASRR